MNKLSTIISTIPIAIIATIITIIVTHIREYLKDTKIKRRYAAILYYDMNDSIDMIKSDIEGVLKNRFTFIDKYKLYDYLVSVRDIISEDSFKNIKIYYKNIFLLESCWEKYWDCKDQKEIKSLEKEYYEAKNLLKSLYENDKQGFINTINILKDIAKIK
ncbi:hypothetical protein [Clostridium botulinum]|uniref:Uncharacterized protein n=4 Tax=Clostridium botulinum TaxID=1491 RepID=A5I1Q0_CLOBH|nr:hypothetical protein [Clostridium botulinum]EKN43028.1 hypothetical protein CFSAN001627_03215 [Clostridium botulinum CFSAN001627]EPS47521.1 hypothetical protein CFSAN002367_23646 [Clostridium botulinum CFSAN002367]ABS32844.1 hypothetical protein CLB_1444 [Clostridium botulinum A str. ATCC 19397]ABS39243.1 hypothetical protein CLC_1456 [Clostridium botulinum A str. Hall]APQ74372.1 hypothetical protein RSJ9_1885 [Clostridium botulinum]